jgi:histidyl-tRNA synthetase
VALHGDASVLAEAERILGGKGRQGFDALRRMADMLAHYGIPHSDYEFDMGVVRGLDYYTGMVFELDSPNLGAEKQVGGGGAYTLAEVFGGEPVAQTGFALGVDRLVLAAEAEGVFETPKGLDAYVVPIGESLRDRAVEILTALRAAGLRADVDLVGRGPSKNLDYANAIGARAVVLVGERELKGNAVSVRDMKTGQQREVSLETLVDALRSGTTGSALA